MFIVNFQYFEGVYFYPTPLNEARFLITDTSKDKITADGKVAEWSVPANESMKYNVYLLMEHDKLKSLLERKANLVSIFKASKSDQSMNALVSYMNNVIPILIDILRQTHRLYWQNDVEKIRSGLSFKECLEEAIDYGYTRLEISNLITNVENPSGILSTQINKQLSDIYKADSKKLGKKESELMSRKKSRSKK